MTITKTTFITAGHVIKMKLNTKQMLAEFVYCNACLEKSSERCGRKISCRCVGFRSVGEQDYFRSNK
jgi:hypothetical protein